MNRCTDCRHLTGPFRCGASASNEIDPHEAYVLGWKRPHLRCHEVRASLKDYADCPLFAPRIWRDWMLLALVAMFLAALAFNVTRAL